MAFGYANLVIHRALENCVIIVSTVTVLQKRISNRCLDMRIWLHEIGFEDCIFLVVMVTILQKNIDYWCLDMCV